MVPRPPGLGSLSTRGTSATGSGPATCRLSWCSRSRSCFGYRLRIYRVEALRSRFPPDDALPAIPFTLGALKFVERLQELHGRFVVELRSLVADLVQALQVGALSRSTKPNTRSPAVSGYGHTRLAALFVSLPCSLRMPTPLRKPLVFVRLRRGRTQCLPNRSIQWSSKGVGIWRASNTLPHRRSHRSIDWSRQGAVRIRPVASMDEGERECLAIQTLGMSLPGGFSSTRWTL